MSSHCPTPPRLKLKALLVEDSLDMRELLAESLEGVPGLDIVAVAETAADAIAAFEFHRPDLLILDLSLKGSSGLEVLREVKQRMRACQILVFTGHDALTFRQHCLTAGADYFFSKNREYGDLIRLLQRLTVEEPRGAA